MISPEEAEELRKAAEEELAKGKSREDVMREMVEVGYSEDDVEAILPKPEESESPEPPKIEESEKPESPKPEEPKAFDPIEKQAIEQETTEAPSEKAEKQGGSKKKILVVVVVVAIIIIGGVFFFLNYL